MVVGVVEIDVHGMTTEDAIKEIRRQLAGATSATYRIRVIHGYHGGTRIRDGIQEEFGYERESKVKRISMGNNPGITELILREL
ncbi:MAG: Smr/MutS family protein [Lachnospiraceae bacterium]|nr:Smr/MutS family protein [Lachnospiraceae bacterium]